MHIALGCEDGTISILDAKTYATLLRIEGHEEPVSAVAFSPDRTRLVSASDDQTVRIWDVHSGKCVSNALEGHDWPVCAVAFLPDGKSIATGLWNGTVRLWETESGKPIGAPWNARLPVISLAFSPDNTRLISAVVIKEHRRIFKAEEATELPPSSEARCHVLRFPSDGSAAISGLGRRASRHGM
ncbi:WD40 repeat-like protein [Mycena sanguinolenta]|uniref:WD40 repeat-like protein n=1 Tax=Mycena sanguinolenta TaxID=230812 RepID=A0A8H7DLK7_9AGAR|nr:WD40 repeat-like protein [Mycena sanguinolenta]